ncbi:MAG TPA: serine hydrolase [Chitinophagaceae bacterium]|jgi:CubicO group peptidase (beta-lactamase class C family)|nr:serine hydrolase [Chitinophagaceae bacterium]
MKMIRALFSCLFVSLLALQSFAQSSTPVVAAFIDSLVSSNLVSNEIPGAVISIVKNGETIYLKGYGYANIERKVAVDSQTTSFRIASLTKIFTTVAILKLAEEKRINIDADISSVLKELGVKLKFSDPVTIRHLLTHTSGLDNSDIGDAARDSFSIKTLSQYFKSTRVVQIHKPGTTWHYSNAGMGVLGYIIERTTGLSYASAIDKIILQPLHMQNSNFEKYNHNWAVAYDYDFDKFQEVSYEFPNIISAGGLSSTAPDMQRFMSFLLDSSNSKYLYSHLFHPGFSYHPLMARHPAFNMNGSVEAELKKEGL